MIRRYNSVDIKSIVELENATLGTTLGEEMLISELDNPLSYIYVYEENNVVIGYISFLFDGDIAEVLNFCVDISNQSKGIGTMLLSNTLNIFKGMGGRTSVLEVRESNNKAIGLYKKLGYKLINIRKNYYSNGENALVLEKEL